MPLGKINSSSSFFSVPWQFLRTQTTYFYNCSLLKSMRAENRRAGWSLCTVEGSYFSALPKSLGTDWGPDLAALGQTSGVKDAGFPPDSLLLPSLLSFLLFFPFLSLSLLSSLLPSFSSFLSSFSFIHFKFFLRTTYIVDITPMPRAKKSTRDSIHEEYTL